MTKLYNKLRPYWIISLLVVISTIVLWLPFLLKMQSWFGFNIAEPNFHYIYRHFDGPLYIVVAKTWYNIGALERFGLESTLPPSYFAAHLPLYPLLINSLMPFIGYLKAMVLVNILATLGLGWMFYFIITKFRLTKHPLILTTVLMFLPRFLVVRGVGAPESLFMLLILGSLYFFEQKNYILAGLLGGLSVATKTPGILLVAAYGLVYLERFMKTKQIDWRGLWLALIPGGLVVVFTLYWIQYGDFFAYFHSGDNIHLVAPFAAFNAARIWVGDHWLEDIVFYFALYGIAITYLWKSRYRSFLFFALVFTISVLFVEHRDIARYSLPVWPLAVIGLEKFFTSRKFLLVFVLIVIPASYFYAWNFMLYNAMPITLWKPFL